MEVSMNVPLVVWITWAFAAWWLFVAFRDYRSPASPRRGNGLALGLALVAAGQLGWLGYVLLRGIGEFVLLTLLGFVITLVLWSVVARRKRAN
jgi:hypothetical protein